MSELHTKNSRGKRYRTGRSRATPLLLLLFECYLLLSSVQAKKFHRSCSLTQMPVIAIVRDPATGAFVPFGDDEDADISPPGDGEGNSGLVPPNVEPDDSDGNDGNRRYLRGLDHEPAIFLSHRLQQERLNDMPDDNVFYVRQCFCFPPPSFWNENSTNSDFEKPYCPIHKNACGVPKPFTNSTDGVGCFTNNSRTSLIRNAWPVIILWYGALVVYFVFTEQGRNARQFLIRKCCNPSLNHQLIDRMMRGLESSQQRRRQSARRWMFWLRPRRQPQDAMLEQLQRATTAAELARMATESNNVPLPTQLALKTKRYAAPEQEENGDGTGDDSSSLSIDNDDESGNGRISCTICFAEIHNGDRVGALTCDHVFHVDCLKVWLARRNVCPLCQTPNVASPQYQPREEQDNEEGEEDNQVENEGPSTLQQPERTEDAFEARRRFWGFSNDNFRGRTILGFSHDDNFRERTVTHRRSQNS